MSKRQKGLFMKLLLVTIVVQVIVFTWVYCYWSYRNGSEIAPVLSVAFFGVLRLRGWYLRIPQRRG